MSEFISERNSSWIIRRDLLATVSAVVLAAYIGSARSALAEDVAPSIWIELGGQMEQLQGTSSPFTAPFMFVTPTPPLYERVPLVGDQKPPRLAFGLEGKVTFQPSDSDWVFSAAVRYGRSHLKRLDHQQSPAPLLPPYRGVIYTAPFAELETRHDESHTIVDFNAGKDVGLGLLGHGGLSSVNAGVRFAQFSTRSTVNISARPEVNVGQFQYYCCIRSAPTFNQYKISADAARSFHGVGPSLSWNASAVLFGEEEHGTIGLDWGINAAVLFGRQRASVNHTTQVHHLSARLYASRYYDLLYPARDVVNARSRSVVVPNLGGFAGISVKYPNAKISLGYRADFFFGAVDAGIDARRTKDLGFNGPFATISIGLGG